MMRLNTFLVLAVGLIGFGVIGLSYFQSTFIFSKNFHAAETMYSDSIREVSATVLRARVFLLESFSEQINKNSPLARLFLLRKTQSADFRSELERLKSTSRCDVLEIVSLPIDEKSFGTIAFDPKALKAASNAKPSSGFVSSGAEGKLLYYFPLHFLRDVVAVGVIGYDLNSTVANEIKNASNARVHFEFNSSVGAPPNLKVESNPLGRLAGNSQLMLLLVGLLWTLVLAASVFILIHRGFVRRFQGLVSQIEEVVRELEKGRVVTMPKEASPIREITSLSEALSSLTGSISGYLTRIQQKTRTEAVGETAAQVAHDLKSPLLALALALDTESMSTWPEKRRQTVLSVLDRMRKISSDIANRVKAVEEEAPTCEDLSLLLTSILDEKRFQYRESKELRLVAELSARSLFAMVDGKEIQRAISNLIDNAAEAMQERGDIRIVLADAVEQVSITIEDTGPGIPANLFPRIGERGFSFGKAQGSGLGIWHARTVVERAAGEFRLKSQEGQGTAVAITLPQAAAPAWALETIKLRPDTLLVILDDDSAMHAAWKIRLAGLDLPEVQYFKSAGEVINYFVSHPQLKSRMLFLCDYELKGEEWTGLDLLEELGIAEQAILVTGHYFDAGVRERCLRSKIRLVNKASLGSIPVTVESDSKRKDIRSTRVLSAILLISGLGILGTTAHAQKTADLLTQSEIRLEGAAAIPARPIQVVLRVEQNATGIRFQQELLQQVVLESLRRRRFAAVRYPGNFLKDFQVGAAAGLLSPKLIVEVALRTEAGEAGYTSTCSLDYLEFTETGTAKYKARSVWKRSQQITGASAQDIEISLIQYVQKELSDLELPLRTKNAPATAQSRGKSPTSSFLAYRLKWTDPDPRRGRLYAGVSAGTPALFNLHLGFWGTPSVPVVLDVSGMFYSYARRGFQGLAGWAFDNEGPWKQGVGLAFTELGESATSVGSTQYDPSGQPNAIATTVLGLHPYLGPAYFADWNQFRVQVGLQTRLNSDGIAPVRVMFQIGFLPTLPF